MFLVNELVVDDKTRKQMTKSELNARVTIEVLEMKRSKRTTTSTFNALQSFPAP